MSLYDDATFIFSAEAAAGHVGRAHALKPVEKLKDTELITDTGFDDSSEWTTGTGWSISGGKAVADGTGSGTGADLKNTTADLSGKTVKISFEISDYEQGNVRIYFHGANSTAESSAFSGNGIHTFTHVVTSGHNLSTGPRSFDSFKGKIDNFSIKEVEVRSLDYEVIRDANLTATRVKADGLIEKGRENIFTHSNAFDDADWSKATATVTSGQSGYDGTTNAWDLAKTTEFGGLEQTVSSDDVQTFSLYAKADSVDYVRLWVTGSKYAIYYLSGDGSVTAESGNIDAQIEKIGTAGWYRCSLTVDASVTLVKINPSANATAADLGTTGSIHVQNAQLEAGLVATPYIDSKEVTGEAGVLANEPRYDYLTSTDDCPGALIEPERTNLFEHSEYLAGPFNPLRVTFEENNAKSPEGVENAVFCKETSATNTHGFQFIDFDIEDDEFYSLSFFVKAKGREKFFVQFSDSTVMKMNVTVDLSGTPSAVDNSTGHTGSEEIIDYGDGWYRVEINGKEGLADDDTRNINFFFIQDASGTTTNYAGDTTKGLLFYGLQIEKGPWCSSYIPTHGSTATRENDTYRTPIDTSGVYAQDDFTVFVDYKDFKTHGAESAGLWRFLHRNVTTKSVFQYNTSIGYTGADHHKYEYLSNQATDGAHKVAIVYNRDSVKVYLDGAESKVDYTVNTDMLGICRSELRYGKSKMTVNRVMVFDRPLTKDEAIALTT